MTVAKPIEAEIQLHLDEGEALEAAAGGIVSRWLPQTWPGELFAQPVVVALTARRVLVLEVPRFSNRGADLVFAAPRGAVRATVSGGRWSGWTPVLGRRSRLRLTFPDRTLKVYVDRAWRNEEAAVAAALGAKG